MIWRKISATNESGTATYEYDDFGRLTKETDVTGAVKEYTYDENGNRLTFILTIDGTQQMNATYTYDKMNQLTGVTIGGDATTYGYDENGNIVNKTTGALVTTYSYNNGNLLTEMDTKQSGVNRYNYTSTYYLDGNKKEATDSQNYDYWYTYNGLGQLKAEEQGNFNYYYTYDAYGNRIKTSYDNVEIYGTTQYTYDANNKLLTEVTDKQNSNGTGYAEQTTIHYAYDMNGNQIYKISGTVTENSIGEGKVQLGLLGETVPDAGTIEMYCYNGFGQLIHALVNATTATYTYNADGLRMSKTVNGKVTTHILDGANVVADKTTQGISKYNRGRELISMEQNGQKGYYIFNGHGDVVKLIDEEGVHKDRKCFSAFGIEMPYWGETSATDDLASLNNPFGYAGEYADAETGNIYLRARYYNPSSGRFVSEDTHWNTGNMIFGDNAGDNPVPSIAAIMQSGNLYAYCSNNPVNRQDSNGQEFESVRAITKSYGGTVSDTKYDERGMGYVEISIPKLGVNYGFYFNEHSDIIGPDNIAWMERTDFLDMVGVSYSVDIEEVYVTEDSNRKFNWVMAGGSFVVGTGGGIIGGSYGGIATSAIAGGLTTYLSNHQAPVGRYLAQRIRTYGTTESVATTVYYTPYNVYGSLDEGQTIQADKDVRYKS